MYQDVSVSLTLASQLACFTCQLIAETFLTGSHSLNCANKILNLYVNQNQKHEQWVLMRYMLSQQDLKVVPSDIASSVAVTIADNSKVTFSVLYAKLTCVLKGKLVPANTTNQLHMLIRLCPVGFVSMLVFSLQFKLADSSIFPTCSSCRSHDGHFVSGMLIEKTTINMPCRLMLACFLASELSPEVLLCFKANKLRCCQLS